MNVNTKCISTNFSDKHFPDHLFAENLEIRAWALKTIASLAMMNVAIVPVALNMYYKQFIINHNPQIWSISIQAMCEIMDRTGVIFMVTAATEETADENGQGSVVDLLFILLGQARDEDVKNSLVTGLCRLILR